MADWLRKIGLSKKKQESEKIEDFVLYGDDNADGKETETVDAASESPELFETAQLDLAKISEAEQKAEEMTEEKPDENAEENAEENAVSFSCPEEEAYFSSVPQVIDEPEQKKPSRFLRPQSKKSILMGSGIAAGAIVLIAAVVVVFSVVMNPLHGYTEVTVAKGNVIPSMNTSGVMEANAYYSITSLVSGTVEESKPEVGDRVEAGTVLYKLDDTEAQLSLKRAQNQLDKSKAVGASSKVSTSRIYAGESGVIQTLNIKSGSSVSAGQIVATILKSDGNAVSVTSSVSGTVSSVSVSRGRSVTAGTLIASVTDDTTLMNQKTNTYDQKSNEYDVEAAKKQLENYTIKSPVSGIVTQKNAKVGDNVAITNLDNPMMVIVDMNSMKFTFLADEKQVMDLEVGQNAIITTDSIPNETFAGEVSRVSNEGKQDDEGNVQFEIDVTIDEPGDLKAGMTVQAKIVLDSATNVMYLPEKALLEADGQNAVVLVKEDKLAENTSDNKDGGASDEELAFPWIKVPKGCRLVTVRYGISDGTNVEIISGLAQGNVVVYNPKWETKDLIPSSATATPSPAKSNRDTLDTDRTESPSATASAAPREEDAVVDEEIKRQIQQKIMERQNGETDAPNVTKKPIGVSL